MSSQFNLASEVHAEPVTTCCLLYIFCDCFLEHPITTDSHHVALANSQITSIACEHSLTACRCSESDKDVHAADQCSCAQPDLEIGAAAML